MDTARKYGLVFNKDNCKIRQERFPPRSKKMRQDQIKTETNKSRRTPAIPRHDPVPKPLQTRTECQNSTTKVTTKKGHRIQLE